jgi:hypothetical protein
LEGESNSGKKPALSKSDPLYREKMGIIQKVDELDHEQWFLQDA